MSYEIFVKTVRFAPVALGLASISFSGCSLVSLLQIAFPVHLRLCEEVALADLTAVFFTRASPGQKGNGAKKNLPGDERFAS